MISFQQKIPAAPRQVNCPPHPALGFIWCPPGPLFVPNVPCKWLVHRDLWAWYLPPQFVHRLPFTPGMFWFGVNWLYLSNREHSQLDPETEGPVLPTKESEEFRPFSRRVPEFKFWFVFRLLS
jgi:hypothetical protein